MLKLRIALCLAFVVGALTLAYGIVSGARIATVMYRVMISFVVFSMIGYGLAIVVEKFINEKVVYEKVVNEKVVNEIVPQQQNDDAIAQQTSDELPTESSFSPFTSEHFEQVPSPKE